MNRGVRADIKASKDKKAKDKLNRSKSRSRSKSPQVQRSKSNKKIPNTTRDQKQNNRNRSRSRSPQIEKSQSKKALQKSASSKKIKRSASQERVKSPTKILSAGKELGKSPKQIERVVKQTGLHPNSSVAKKTVNSKEILSVSEKKPEPMIKQEEKDMGLIVFFPDSEKIILKPIDTLDEVFEKFLEMVSNDNDASYVMNALPEFRDLKKQDESQGRDFISGKITRLSGVFEGLNIEKITSPLRKVPVYYTGQSGKNLQIMKIMLQTKFKVQVDLGFLQYSQDGDKMSIFRVYISKIYRKMNYTVFSYLEVLKLLMEKHPSADRWSIFILERNMGIHKFFKYMGLRIEKVITDSRAKGNVDYFQEFSIKKKDLQTAISAFK